MVKVYFESKGHAEEVATFDSEELYMLCRPQLVEHAKKHRMEVTESVEPIEEKEYKYIVASSTDVLQALNETDFDSEISKDEFFDEYGNQYEVGKFATDNLDFDLLLMVKNWGDYQVINEKQYNEMR